MKKILVCEDEKEVRDLLTELLLKEKYEIALATDGKEAVERAKDMQPDLILLDIRMPKLDGFEVAQKVREFNNKVKIIFITGFQSPELLKEAEKYDIAGYIVKPSTTKDILETLQKAFKN